MTMKILREIQRDASPPPLSVAIPSKLYHEKKSSPISTVDFERMEEMKLPDAMGLIQIVHRLEPTSAHRVGEKQGTFSRSKSFEGNAVVKPIVLQHAFSSVVESSATKPPLRPRPSRGDGHSRSGSDSSGSEAERQGEQAMMNLADDCLASGDIKTAVALYESLKKELEKKYGIFHASVAQCLDKIGGAQLICGKFELATENLEKAISIQCGVLGIHHLDVGCSMEKLATAKMQLRQVHDAHELYRRALRIKRSRLGLYHQDVAHIQTQLACIYFHCGEILGAQAAFEESLHAYRHLEAVEQHSSWTVKAADALCSIGSIKLMQRNHTRAIGYFAEALRAQKHIYGLYHPSVITTLDNLGHSHSKCKHYQIASEIFGELLHAQTTYYLIFNYDCYQTLKKLNYVYEKLNKLSAAVDATFKALSIQKQCLTPEDVIFRKTKKLLEHLQMKHLAICERQGQPHHRPC